MGIISSGSNCFIAGNSPSASPSPAAPPASASTRFSTHSCRRILLREAPSAIRVAISGVRRWIRASISPARFAHAISRMNPTAAISACVCSRIALPAYACSKLGKYQTFSFARFVFRGGGMCVSCART